MSTPTHKHGVLALDIGTSSVRAVVYDVRGRMRRTTLSDVPYKVRTAEPGEVSSDPEELITLIAQSIDGALRAARKDHAEILAAGVSCYWHSLMGADHLGRPTTEPFTGPDTRGTPEPRDLRRRFNEQAYHPRTGGFSNATSCPSKFRC